LLFQNFASDDAGGDFRSGMINCTIINNFSLSGVGGVDGSTLHNSIVYGNSPTNGTNTSYDHCCTFPLPSGDGNITNAPTFQADGFHLTADSACRAAGNSNAIRGVDISGLPWLNPPSIGCAEYYTNAAPVLSLEADYTNVVVGSPLSFQAAVTGGQPAYLLWNFGDNTPDGGGLTNSHTWSTPGDFTVQLTAFFANSPIPATQSITIHVVKDYSSTILTQPADQTATEGGDAQFNVVATGSPAITYQWKFDGQPIAGATNASLQLHFVETNQAGLYSVIVTNPLFNPTAQIISSNAVLTVVPAVCVNSPSLMTAWWRAEGDVSDAIEADNTMGQNITFTNGKVGQAFFFADGASSISAPASPIWYVGNVTGLTIECWIQPDAFAVGGNGAPIVEWDVGTTDWIQFWAGDTLMANVVDGVNRPHTVQSAHGLLDTNHWQHVAFTLDNGSGIGTIYLNGNVVASNYIWTLPTTTGCQLNIGWSPSTTNFFGGKMDELTIYKRVLSHIEIQALFNAEGAGKCTVPIAPLFVLPPGNVSAVPGGTGEFDVIASGTTPLSYQWMLNGNPVDNATNASLVLSNALCSQDGSLYSVSVSNAAGSIVSGNATFSIINTPPQISSISNQIVSYSAPFVTVPFLVSDPGLPGSAVTVSAVSSNTNVVPNEQIVLNGTDTNRTATLTANSNLFAGTTISMIAAGPCGATNQTNFILLVTNFPPQFSSIAAQRGPINAAIGPIAFAVSDFETPADQLTLAVQSSNGSVLPTNQVVLGGSGTNRTVTIIPGTNFAGTATVTLMATDSLGASGSVNFSVTLDQFSQIMPGIPPLLYSAVAGGDYDNDGKLDLLVSGTTNGSASGAITRVYHNDGGMFTNFISLTGVYKSAVAWSDYDRDGLLDFAVCGLNSSNVPVTLVFHNNGNGTFTDISAGLTGEYSGSVAWGDFNNDGAPDLFVSGLTPTNTAKLYRNNGNGTFTDMNVNLPGPSSGTAVWGDYDHDGRLDLLLVGLTNNLFGKSIGGGGIYRNLGDGVFTNVWPFNPGFSTFGCSAVWGDFDNDGWLDVAVSGGSTVVYRNNGDGTFTQKTAINSGDISEAWGDFDNDGYPDLVVGNLSASHFYHNNGNGTFTDTLAALPNISNGSLAAGDFNNDGSLDLICAANATTIDQNNSLISNTPPIAPGNLATITTRSNGVVFSWSPSSDSQTGSNGLNYNLRVGTTPGGVDVVPPLADPLTGQRRLAALGNVGPTNRAMLIDLPKGTYYWSVQAIDTTFAGSPFGAENSFVITNSRPTISPITDKTIPPAETLAVPFSISDAETDVGSLVVTGRSSNTNVVPLTNIVFSVPDPGAPWNYLASITAITNGVCGITITVTDPQGAFASAIFTLTAAQFSLVSTNFLPVQSGFAVAGDFDNDGKLDLLIAGNTNSLQNASGTQLYHNEGEGVFTPVATGLPNVAFGSAAWGDFDNDGNLDLVLTGTTNGSASGAITRIYRNNGGSFTDIGAGLPGVYFSAVAWGDYDNDGRLDLLITGSTNSAFGGGFAGIFRNMGDGTFSNVITFPGVLRGSVAFADFDGDGYLDVVMAGLGGNGGATAVVYRNNGGKSYSALTNLTGVFNCSIAVGDFDNDGWPDILLAGSNFTRVYRNNGNGTFTDIGALLPAAQYSCVAWGDFDNDGRPDIFLCGTSNNIGSGAFARVYHNSGAPTLSQTFTNYTLYSGMLQTPNYEGAVAVGDFDNNGTLDVFYTGTDGIMNGAGIAPSQSLLFRNNSFTSNTPPSPPTGLTYTRSNTVVMLAWDKSSDSQTTNSNGLKYQLRIGTTPGGIQIKSPQSDLITGYRRTVQTSDAFTTNWPIVDLPPGTYYWSVQAIDTAFAGSPFSAEATFTVLQPPIAVPDAFSTAMNTPATFAATNLTANDIDPSGLPLTVTAVSTNSAQSGLVSLVSGLVTYAPPTNFAGNDVFSYSVSDGQSATASSTVTATVAAGGIVWLKVISGPMVENGDFVVRFAGVPGLTYTVEAASSVTGPWVKIANPTAPNTDQGFGVGGFEVRDSMINNTTRFYRTIYPSY
jgi:hypothetical protein